MLAVSILILAIGIIFKLLPPKKINYWYGHRTSFAMKNQDTWNEAQRFSANSLIILGIVYIALGLIFLVTQNADETFQAIVFLLGIITMIVSDEVHLRKVFNSDGSRKM